MAGKKENIKALFTNTRSRVIIVFTVILLVVAVIIGLTTFLRSGNKNSGASDVPTTPGIQSIPGAMNQTAQYAKLQEAQNVNQATNALKSGSSAIPTIVRSQQLGAGAQVVGAQGGEAGIGFSALAREDDSGLQRSAWVQALQTNSCNKATVSKVVTEGAALADLKSACTCIELKDDGYQIGDLQKICSCKELKASGFNARQLRDSGFNAGGLRTCGFNACELRNAGFSALDMKDGGFTDGELKGAGFSDPEIARASGIPDGMTAADVLKAGCQVANLERLRTSGVTAAAIRRISGCSASQLKSAGFSAQALKDAGFTAAELKRLGFTPAQLRQAGYSARDLLNAGFTPQELAAAGYTPADILAAEAELPPGITADDIKKAGCAIDAIENERLAGVSAQLIKKYAGCSASALRSAGFTEDDLAKAGFTPQQIAATHYTTDEAIRAAACDPIKLKALFKDGVSSRRVHDLNGCSDQQLKAAGFSQSLSPTAAALLAAGHLKDCSVATLSAARAGGLSAATLRKTLGCNAAAMKAAGFSASELKAAGFTAAELKNAGFSLGELKTAGFTAKELKEAGFTAAELKAVGFNASQLKAAGFDAKALKDAGFSASELKAAGFSAKDLNDAGYSAAELAAAGIQSSQVAGLSTQGITPGVSSTMPGIPSYQAKQSLATTESTNSQQLQAIVKRQNQQAADQRYQQKIQQRTSEMLTAANQSLQNWKKAPSQVYTEGNHADEKKGATEVNNTTIVQSSVNRQTNINVENNDYNRANRVALIKTGDILFAVIDTSINSDEPGPILATIVSGKLRGAKLIGSFNLPNNADKMVITFNTLSVPGAAKSISINAFAIDANTARTALSSDANHHYLQRYGSLFASSFIEGFGNAFQSANTTVTIGGTGGGDNVTVQNGIGRSALQNAVIGLATVGKSWGQVAQQQFNRPTTVQVYSGTGVGVLFTQDIASL